MPPIRTQVRRPRARSGKCCAGICARRRVAITGHYFSWDNGADGIHQLTQMWDDVNHTKQWSFASAPGQWYHGVLAVLTEATSWSSVKRSSQYTWTTDAAGTPYISKTETTMDWGTANAVTSRATQVLDTHGNVTTSSVYGYVAGNYPLSQPGPLLRTYTNTYLNSSNYTSRYIFNRLQGSSVTDGTNSLSLVSNSFDQSTLTDLTNPAPRQHDTAYGTGFVYRGNMTSQTGGGKTVTRTYDIAGNIKTASDGNLGVSAATGSATNYSTPSSITPNGSSGLTSSYTFNGALDLTGATMPNGATIGISYASQSQPSTVTSATGAVTNYTYSFSSSGPSTVTATTNGHWVKNTMDGLGRVIKVETGEGPNVKSTTQSEYGPCACSPMGKVKRVSQPYAPGGTVYWTEYTYDALGRTLTIKKPDSSITPSTTSYEYTGNTTKVTDAAGTGRNSPPTRQAT